MVSMIGWFCGSCSLCCVLVGVSGVLNCVVLM